MHCIKQLNKCHKYSSFLVLGLPCLTTRPGQGSPILAFLSAPAPPFNYSATVAHPINTPDSLERAAVCSLVSNCSHLLNKALNSHTSLSLTPLPTRSARHYSRNLALFPKKSKQMCGGW